MHAAKFTYTIVLLMALSFFACDKGCDARFKTAVPAATETKEEHDLAYYQKLLSNDWQVLKVKIKEQWAHITDLDLAEIEGNFEKFSNTLQLKYQSSKADADKWIKEFLNRNKE